jgi:hypothetical protein
MADGTMSRPFLDLVPNNFHVRVLCVTGLPTELVGKSLFSDPSFQGVIYA